MISRNLKLDGNNKKMREFSGLVLLMLFSCVAGIFYQDRAYADWQCLEGPLKTEWAKKVSVDNALPEYPRPQMTREDWINLNGLWKFTITDKIAPKPISYSDQILVPYPAGSALSGIEQLANPDQAMWYHRAFSIPDSWKGKRVLLRFGAVDYEVIVWVNGRKMGSHRGGYDPFSFDITEALSASGEQVVTVMVTDPTDSGSQPRGKQVLKPKGIRYTRVNGIWQTVWLEPVPQTYISKLKMTPDIDKSVLRLEVELGSVKNLKISLPYTATVYAEDNQISEVSGDSARALEIPVKDAKLWSPDNPYLYKIKVDFGFDKVDSYFAMRKISLGKDAVGVTRIMLNNKPVFSFGPLDQGFWPDGIYTAPTDEALRYDIEMTKKLGFNMLRKHVKVEPDRFYYWCDVLGIMVWQDMPSADSKTPESKRQFEIEHKAMIDALYNHPSIVMWVPFNEGWGQYDTARITGWIKNYDPSRLVNSASGWTDYGTGDVFDIHAYPGPSCPDVEQDRAIVLGEFGGLGHPVDNHVWQKKDNWGYRDYKEREELVKAYLALLEKLRPMVSMGLSAAVYTQTTDVETEVNGLMTYDRAVVKIPLDIASAANKVLYLEPGVSRQIAPTSMIDTYYWRYTIDKPDDDWFKPDFEDSGWQQASGAFGKKDHRVTYASTEWTSSDIWLRRNFQLEDTDFGKLYLRIQHDDDAEVYINGKLIKKLEGRVRYYINEPLDDEVKQVLKCGTNTIAVHCHQVKGGQFIDAGIVDVKETKK